MSQVLQSLINGVREFFIYSVTILAGALVALTGLIALAMWLL